MAGCYFMGLFFIEISYFAKATTQYTVLSPRRGTQNEVPYTGQMDDGTETSHYANICFIFIYL